MAAAQRTGFALEGQDGLDPRLLIAAEAPVSVHQSDVVSRFSRLGRRKEAAEADGSIRLI